MATSLTGTKNPVGQERYRKFRALGPERRSSDWSRRAALPRRRCAARPDAVRNRRRGAPFLREGNEVVPDDNPLVAARRSVPDLSALVHGYERRRDRRSAWHSLAARLSLRARRRRPVALSDLSVADGGLRL